MSVYRDLPPFADLERSIDTGAWVLLGASWLMVLGYVARWAAKGAQGKLRSTVSRAQLAAGSAQARGPVATSAGIDRGKLIRLTAAAHGLGVGAIVATIWLRFSGFPSLDELFVVSSTVRMFEMRENVVGNASAILALCIPAEVVGYLWLWDLARKERTSRAHFVLAVFSVFVAVMLGIMSAVLTGSRVGVLKSVLACAWAWMLATKTKPLKAILIVTGAVAVVAPMVYLQGELRDNAAEVDVVLKRGAPTLFEALSDLSVKVAATGHFVAIERTGYIAEYVFSGLNTFPFAGSIVLGIVGLVPRVIFPDKPTIHEGNFVAEEIAGIYTGGGMPAGLVGGLLLNFGPFGLLGLVAYGWLIADLDGRAARADRDRRAFLIVTTFGFLAAFDLLQSGISTAIPEGIARGVTLAVVQRQLRSRRSESCSGEVVRPARSWKRVDYTLSKGRP